MERAQTASQIKRHPQQTGKEGMATLTLGALGIVYGDIGTSPLYTVKQVFGAYPVLPSDADILGALSLIFWALTLVVSLKYVVFIMRTDNDGEGGTMALLTLLQRMTPKPRSSPESAISVPLDVPEQDAPAPPDASPPSASAPPAQGIMANPRVYRFLLILGLFGASLFYGDSLITPAISVLSAVEGLEIAAPALKAYVIPLALSVLIGLFLFQRQGTQVVGRLFGPVMGLWFTTLGILGVISIVENPSVLQAVNPIHGGGFLLRHQWEGFLTLGAVVLAVTGAEALYADMGHFGKRPIRAAWFWFVFPALLLNYFGQGALLMRNHAAIENPFYLLAPGWGLYPLLILATAATVIASQAVISGAFSITRQAIHIGYLPRMRILHTSAKAIGQVYVPVINWALLIGVVALVLGFQSSENLAAAYGISVTGEMAVTTVLAFIVARQRWDWPWPATLLGIAFFLTIDLAFFSANSLKVFSGGWISLAIGITVFTLMTTWKRGRELVLQRLGADAITLEAFITMLAHDPPPRVSGTAVFLTASPRGVPRALLHNLAHNKVLHERIVVLTVVTPNVPRVRKRKRLVVQALGDNFFRVIVRYGFAEDLDIPKALEEGKALGWEFNMLETSFFISRETLVSTQIPGMAKWREKLFIGMARNAESATFFCIPTNRIVEVGVQVEL